MSGAAQLVTSGPLILALPVAAAAGAVTFLSPCCLPLVPGYLSFVTGMAGASGSQAAPAAAAQPAVAAEGGAGPGVVVATRPIAPAVPAVGAPRARVVAGTALFVLGFSVVFVAYGAALGGLGHLLTGHAQLLTRILGGLTILLGLLFAGVFDRFSFAGRIVRPSARPKAGLAGVLLLGVMFGLGWTPCIGPTLTAVLALSASSGTVFAGRAAGLRLRPGPGHPVPARVARLPDGDAGVRLRPAAGSPGDQDRRGHAGLRRPARGDRRLVHVDGLAPGPLGQQLPAPAIGLQPSL